jgi:penicillin-binding protein 2
VSHYHSIYATQQRRSARWLWALLILVVIAVSATTGALIAQGETPSSLLGRVSGGNGAETPDSNFAAVDDAPTATATSEPELATAPTATAEPTESAGIEQASAAETEPTEETVAQIASLASPSAGESIPLEDPTSPIDVVRTYGERWAAGDYGGLYDLLTAEAQATIPRQEFIDRYAAIQAEAGLLTVSVEVTGEASLDSKVPITVTFTSSKVDEIQEQNSVQLAKDGDDWRVAWTPSLIFAELGDGCIDFTAEPVRRGSILDRNGEPLAYDGTINVVGIVPGMLENENESIRQLSKLIDLPTSEIKEKYEDGNPDWFMPIKTYSGEMDPELLSGIGQLEGVAVRTETARLYPLGAKAAHITGYVTKVTAEDMAADTEGTLSDDDWIGRAGLEAGADELLTGTPGGRLAVVDCDTRVEQSSIAERKTIPPQDIVLTIDKDFQVQVDNALGDVKGSAVIIDPRNGAILAMASHPAYDPNWFVTGFSDKDWAFVTNETERPLLNRAMEASYPTGSIFKVITMAAGMHDLGYDGSTEIDCPQQWSIPGTDQIWKDWTFEEGLGAQGVLSLHWALVNSCNTVFYQIGNDLDTKDESALPNMAKAFGLGAPTEIPYLAEVSGIVPDPAWKQENLDDYWARGDAVNLAIGQGYLEATPLQMANAYAAIANNGKVLRPFIVEFAQDADGSLKRVGKRRVLQELPLTNDQISEIQSALRDQTSNGAGSGSARVFGDFGWQIAGKTGTAQNQMTKDQKPHSWFAGFGPYGERATIASIVMVESSGEGVSFAAPRTRQIYEAYLETNLAEESSKS